MAFDSMRDFVARHVMKSVNVYKIDDFNLDPPDIHGIEHNVKTHSVKPEIKLSMSKPYDFDKPIKCKATVVDLTAHSAIKVRTHKIKRYTKQDVKTHKLSFSKKIRTWNLLKQIQALPQERPNMLKLQKKRISVANNEMILAWYWPIVDKAVLKLALDKQRGTLLVWYTPASRHNKARGVYLIRRLGMGEKPEWRWV